MKKIFYILPLALLFTVAACNNDKDEPKGPETVQTPEKQADSLWKEVMAGHDIGMAKMTKIEKAQAAVQQALDSIAKLPAAAKKAAAGLQTQLDSLKSDLKYADFAMNKWMEELQTDIRNKATDIQVQYLSAEKEKVTKVKDNILNSLAKADSLFKTKF